MSGNHIYLYYQTRLYVGQIISIDSVHITNISVWLGYRVIKKQRGRIHQRKRLHKILKDGDLHQEVGFKTYFYYLHKILISSDKILKYFLNSIISNKIENIFINIDIK
ncbi:hypothetical protein RF11_06064 [Thelohanellus kitauei]|uniref:Uncharacterized protein n=1 Tax=Thelohanellus kitauei TaxID=669202 RepID=A0A0C2M455_THEKT|nr:hypothetical protein RF11_06064 [Thelohanellus kitauei]